MAQLQDKVAVITGGASGIGEATARLFVEEGARVLIADMQAERGAALAEELGEAAAFLPVEVRQEAEVKAAVDDAVARWGRLDCMFNNAGFGGALGPLEEIPADDFDLTFAVLVRGVFLGMKHAIPVMKAQGSGCILNTGSIAGLMAGRGPNIYCAAKAAVIHLTRTTALEVADWQIRVNAICPGYIMTPLSANTVGRADPVLDERYEEYAGQQPIPRPGLPEDIARMALFLAGDGAGFVTGQALTVDGGVTAGVPWGEQREAYRVHRPIRVYHPDRR